MPRPAIPPLIAAALLVAGCAPLRPSDGAQRPPADVGATERPVGLPEQPGAMPMAGPTRDVGSDQTSAGQGVDAWIAPPVGADAVTAFPGADPVLRSRVAERCTHRTSDLTELSLLRDLVADLAAEGVEPAAAADALILGRCGDLADIVTEVVAQGGEPAAMPVIDRAVAIAGPASILVVERAATEGLMLAGRERVAEFGTSRTLSSADGQLLAQFPPGVARTGVEPGYALYTFVLSGSPAAGATAGDRRAATQELLRVIETYVLADPGEGRGQGPGQAQGGGVRGHSFVVPVSGERADGSLVARAGADVAASARNQLAGYLRRADGVELAARLATSPGPFLVSTLEPRLVPLDPRAARLLVDLSVLGPEYMYNVVDAYDRPVPPEFAGRVGSLQSVRARLVDVLSDAGVAPAEWIVMLGERSLTRTGRSLDLAPRLAVVARGD